MGMFSFFFKPQKQEEMPKITYKMQGPLSV